MGEHLDRQLAAVMFADMVGFTALMQEDEELALQARAKYVAVLNAQHEAFGGRIVQYYGDGALSMFPNSLDAVRCAIEIQKILRQPPGVPVRIGIHVGNVIVEPTGLVGDAVNIASRIESFAVAGGVLVSDSVQDQVRNQPQVGFVKVGTFELKNVDRPFEIYGVAADGLAVPTANLELGKGQRSGGTTIPSFAADIERLQINGAGARGDLARRGHMRLGSSRVHVDRDVVSVAVDMARRGPMVVLGDPGSGKSAVLADIAERFATDGADVLVVDADALAGQSLPQISNELRLDHDIVEVLDRWPGAPPRFLIVDALDQTRGTPAVPAIRRLVERVVATGSWTVIIAVRRFDLRYSSDLRASFAGTDGEARFQDPEFAGTRHVAVGDFTDAELSQVEPTAPEVARAALDGRAGDLLRRPLHLQLAAEVLVKDAGVDFARIRSQVQLLARYWTLLVEEPVRTRGGREIVLTRLAQESIERRRASVDRVGLDAVDPAATFELLGRGVLIEGEAPAAASRGIRPLHALVADYAIARLVVRDTAGAESLLVGEPANALFLRQPLELWLAGLWQEDPSRRTFWDAVLRLFTHPDIPEIAKLVGPTLAADTWGAMSDLEPLLAELDGPRRAQAIDALRHLVASQVSAATRPLVGDGAPSWPALATRLTTVFAPDVMFPARLLVTLLADTRHTATAAQLSETAAAARRLLSWLWDTDSPDLVSAGIAIRAVRQTFSSDPPASEAVIRRGLCRDHVRRRGYEELRHLVDPLNDLEASPSLVVATYTAAFRFEDSAGSEESVLRGGPVLRLMSNRGQEFGMARYVLGEEYRAFAERDPVSATEALVRVVRASGEFRSSRSEAGAFERFTVRGVACRVRDPWSAYSAGSLMGHGAEAKIIADWTQVLGALATRGDPRLDDALRAFLRSNRTYGGWQILLDAARRAPALADAVLALLAQAPPILAARTMTEVICRLIQSARSRPGAIDAVMTAAAALDDVRDRLSACFDGSAKAIPDDDDDEVSDPASTVPMVERPPVDPSPAQVLGAWLDADAAKADESIRAAFRDLVGSLGAHDRDHEEDWNLASRAAGRLAMADADCSDDARQAVELLLHAIDTAQDDGPEFDGDEEIATIPSHWCLLEAVVGVVRVFASGRCDDLVSAAYIDAIAGHELPWARVQLAGMTGAVHDRAPDLAWSILRQLAPDPVASVGARAVSMATRLRRHSPEDAKAVLDAARDAHGATPKILSEAALVLEAFLYIDSGGDIDSFTSAVGRAGRLTDVGTLLHSLRRSITPPAVVDGPDAEAHRRALDAVRAIADIAVDQWRDARRTWEATSGTEGSERAQDAARVLDSVATEIYFASGAYRKGDEEPRATPEQMSALFDEIGDDLRRLLPDLPAPAIQHVVEVAAANAERRPSEAFLLVAEAVVAAKTVGYETDSLAKDLVLGLVRTYIAERADLFVGTSADARAMQRALVQILDSFVSVGWPDAREMAYRLREVLA